MTFGFDLNLPNAWRLIGEFERNFQHDLALGANTAGEYVSVLRKINQPRLDSYPDPDGWQFGLLRAD